jgi:hypothetical protein
MTRAILILLLGTFFFSGSLSALAQDTADDYSDYSYLWEDSKKKKKKKSKDPQPTVEQTSAPETPNPEPTSETTQSSTEETTLQLAPVQSIPADSVPKVEQPILDVPTDSLPSEETPEIKEQTPVFEEAIEDPVKEKKPKKEYEEDPNIQDFRGGQPNSGGGSFNGGFTATLIDDQYFVGMVLSPEFSIGKVGVGLNVPILYGLDDKSIRTEIFKDGIGAARLITYIRYGVQKRDPIYVKVGQLNGTSIGFGGLINNYTNSTSFEKRKVGLHYDLNYKGWGGIDGMYSDFSPGSFNLFSIRPYVRPLSRTGIPIVKTFELGSTIVRDKDSNAIITSDSTSTSYRFTQNGVGAIGIDAGVTLLSIPFIQIDLFANYSKLNMSSQALTDTLNALYDGRNAPETMSDGYKDGSGVSVGLNFRFHFIADILSTDIRIERLTYTEHYLPQFFDATYEINKDAKILSLGSAGAMSGFYGSLTGHILKKVVLGGSLMIPDELTAATPATVQVHADLDRLADKFSFQGSYIKGNLSDLGDAFKFDENSLAKIRMIYHLNKFLATGLDYYWAFTPTSDGGYKATQYISPYFGLSIKF